MSKKKINNPRNIEIHKINPNTVTRRQPKVAKWANRKTKHKKW